MIFLFSFNNACHSGLPHTSGGKEAIVFVASTFDERKRSTIGSSTSVLTQALTAAAKLYGTSLEACANRYIDLTDDACAIVFSSRNVIRYVRRTNNFPFVALKNGDPLPTDCASFRAPSLPLRVATSWAEVDGGCWLEAKQGQRVPALLEQSIRQGDGFQTTLLFQEALNDDRDDDDLEERWTPRFRGR